MVQARRHVPFTPCSGPRKACSSLLAEHGFDTLGQLVQQIPVTTDPIRRSCRRRDGRLPRLALAHPALYRLTFDRLMTGNSTDRRVSDAGRAALEHLRARVARAAHADLLGNRDIDDAIHQFHALCEGIATVELRGTLAPQHAERLAHDAFTALLNGMSNPATTAPPTRKPTTRRETPDKRS